MLGPTKLRQLDQPISVSLEDLVPQDSFYRHLDRSLDLSFVRDLVHDAYEPVGRPSIDPVVFFKLQLIMFFEGIRSERQLMRVTADRLSLRWYLGYSLDEPLPDHSSLTRIRHRYGLSVFRRFFETIIERCQQSGLIWGRELYFDATQVDANASMDSLQPRFAVEAHLERLFDPEDAGLQAGTEATESEVSISNQSGTEPSGIYPSANTGTDPIPFPLVMGKHTWQELAKTNAQRHDWLAQQGCPDRLVRHGRYRRRTDFVVSPTDPDAALMHRIHGGTHFGYHDHYVVDGGKARIILEVLVTPADVMANQPMLDLLWRSCFRWKLRPRQVTGDTTYGTLENIIPIEEAKIRAYVPLPDIDKRNPLYGPSEFTYDAQRDLYICPAGNLLPLWNASPTDRKRRYKAPATTCNGCALKERCTAGSTGRYVQRDFDEEYLERVRAYHGTEGYQKAMRKRKVWVEPLFAEAKDWHGLRRFRLRGLWKVNAQALLTASGQNLKRLLSKWGWGRRPWPGAASGSAFPDTASQPDPIV